MSGERFVCDVLVAAAAGAAIQGGGEARGQAWLEERTIVGDRRGRVRWTARRRAPRRDTSNKVLTASESVRVVKVRVGDEAKGNLPVRVCVCARAWVEEMAGCWRGRQRETAGVVDPFGQ